MKLVKFTRSREELDPAKKSRTPEKMTHKDFEVFVNVDAVTSVDDGEFGVGHPLDPVKTTIHLVGGHNVRVEESIGEVVSAIDSAARR